MSYERKEDLFLRHLLLTFKRSVTSFIYSIEMELNSEKSGTKIGIVMKNSDTTSELERMLRTSDNIVRVCVGEAFMGQLALKAGANFFDIILLKANSLSFTLISEIKGASLETSKPGIIVLFDSLNDNLVIRAITSGADACILVKENLGEINDAIAIVKKGESYLSPAIAKVLLKCITGELPVKVWHQLTFMERRVVAAVVEEHLAQKEVAQKLNISLNTVRFHLKNVYKKLKINCVAELSSKYFAEKHGLVGQA